MIRNRKKKISRILVYLPHWVGDAVMAIPLLCAIKKQHPSCTLSLLTLSHIALLFQEFPGISSIYTFQKKNCQSIREAIQEIKKEQFSLLLIIPNSFSSAWIGWKTRIPIRIGFAHDFRSLLLTHRVFLGTRKERTRERQTLSIQRLLSPLGIPISHEPPQLFLSKEEKKWANQKLFLLEKSAERGKKKNVWIGIHPGALYGSAKCWLPERFRSLIGKLLQEKSFQIHILLFGLFSHKELLHKISDRIDNFGEGYHSRVHMSTGETSLRELMLQIDQCSVLVSNDSGPMHIASALKVPLVALFGSTNRKATGPHHPDLKQEIVIDKEVHCAPCYLRTCPLDFRCMKKISVEEVFRSIMYLLSREGPRL